MKRVPLSRPVSFQVHGPDQLTLPEGDGEIAACILHKTTDGIGPPVEGNNGTYMTDSPWLLSPYHKNMNLFVCPTRPAWRLDNETPSDSSDDVQDSAAYAINRYLVSPHPTDSGWMKQPLHESALESPSATIAVLEAAGDDQRDAVQLNIEDTENQRHLGGINVLWCDGHVKFSQPERLVAGYWTPWEGD